MLYDVHDVYPSYSITKNQYLILLFMSHSMWRTLLDSSMISIIYICCCLFDWQTSSEWPLLDHMANGPSLTLSWSINIGKNTKDMKIWGKYQIATVKWGCRFKYHGPKQEVSAQLHLLRYLFLWLTDSFTSKSACPKLEPCWISTQIRTVTPTRPAAQSCLDVRRWICWCLESPSISWSMMSLVERYSKAALVSHLSSFTHVLWKTLGDTGY